MFIIVEGPDGAGKSTAIDQLTHALWKHKRGCVLVNPKRSPNQHALIEYKERLDFYQPGSGVDLILDRSWYSEPIYGPIWRGTSSVTLYQRQQLEAWALAKGAVVVLLEETDETLVERVFSRSDDVDVEHMTPELVREYAYQYRLQSQSWLLPKVRFSPGFDFQVWPTIRHAEVYERLALEHNQTTEENK